MFVYKIQVNSNVTRQYDCLELGRYLQQLIYSRLKRTFSSSCNESVFLADEKLQFTYSIVKELIVTAQ